MTGVYKKWPVVETHEEARCWKCGGSLSGEPHDSGFPPNHGKWRQKCVKCDMTTWYDLRPKEELTG